MIPSSELQAKIDLWSQAARNGTLTKEQMREAILHMRGERRGAAIASEKSAAKKPSKAPVIVPTAEEMLRDLFE
jgi:hypothetical protein